MVNCVTPKGLGLRLLALVCLVALVLRAEANAQIVLDGSVGPAGTLSGPDFAIGAELGTTLGPNLFHSFSDFNILTGESATFSGPDAIDNVVSRVTGGSVSTIDGLLRSTIAGADFYLVNPSGILFGANAALDVDGSFHASTADHMRLSDGALFSASARMAIHSPSRRPRRSDFSGRTLARSRSPTVDCSSAKSRACR